MNKREKFQEQIALMDIIREKSGINIVNCGHCGYILLIDREAEDVDCLYCNRVMDPSDCPDYLYVGQEFNDENSQS
jgi:hypothetical protein